MAEQLRNAAPRAGGETGFDLIYVDPPFFTEREWIGAAGAPRSDDETQKSNDKSVGTGASNRDDRRHAFDDRWQGGLEEYLAWLGARIRALRALLRPRGVLLLHLDWHAVHYAKVMCDRIFAEPAPPGSPWGAGGFQNELIWYYQTGGASKDRFSRKHDNILLYSNSARFHFDGAAIAIPRTEKSLRRARNPAGARIAATDTHKNPDDVILVPALNPMATERTGYPTQKPVALLELLIKALCPPNGAVADFFCGSGTTLVAAQRLGRHWFGCDVNPAAVALAHQRVRVESEQK